MTRGDGGQSVLADLDDRLRTTAGGWPANTRDRLARFILAHQTSQGGFVGKAGPADLYYTGWALRGLWLIDRINEPARRTARPYLQTAGPANLIELTAWLMAYLAIEDVRPPAAPRLGPRQAAAFGALLKAARTDDGGFGRVPHGSSGSTYLTFLAVLAGQMLGEPAGQAAELLEFLHARRRADGGFAEGPGGPAGSVNPTAAAVAVGLLLDPATGPAKWLGEACEFLQRCQHGDGGWRAWPGAAGGDLLSSFTALYVLAAVDRLDRVDRAAAESFARACLRADGGFAGTPAEREGDVEFTCYGISILALLNVQP